MATMYIELVDGKILNARVKQKTGPQSDFAGYTLLDGEIALVRSSPTGPVIQFKVGPGVFDDLDWSLPSPGAAQKADTSTVFPAGVPGLYIPTEDGDYAGETVDLSVGYTQLIWDGSTMTKAEFPINLSGYATIDDINTVKNYAGGVGKLADAEDLAALVNSPNEFNPDNYVDARNLFELPGSDGLQYRLSAGGIGVCYVFPCDPSTKYYIDKLDTGDRFRIAEFDHEPVATSTTSGSNSIGHYVNDSAESHEYTTSENGTWLAIYVSNSSQHPSLYIGKSPADEGLSIKTSLVRGIEVDNAGDHLADRVQTDEGFIVRTLVSGTQLYNNTPQVNPSTTGLTVSDAIEIPPGHQIRLLDPNYDFSTWWYDESDVFINRGIFNTDPFYSKDKTYYVRVVIRRLGGGVPITPTDLKNLLIVERSFIPKTISESGQSLIGWEVGAIGPSSGLYQANPSGFNRASRYTWEGVVDRGVTIAIASPELYGFRVYEYSDDFSEVAKIPLDQTTTIYFDKKTTVRLETRFLDERLITDLRELEGLFSVEKTEGTVITGNINVRYECDPNIVAPSTTAPLQFGPSDIHAIWDDLLSEYPNIVTGRRLLGYPKQGGSDLTQFPIYEYEVRCPRTVATTVGKNRSRNTPTMLFQGGIHGNEREMCWTVTQFFNDLVRNHITNEALYAIMGNFDFKVVPVVNPSGLSANTRENINGVDLNRNFSYMWNYFESDDKGAAPYSENETALLRQWYEDNKGADFFLDCHTIRYTSAGNAYHVSINDKINRGFMNMLTAMNLQWANKFGLDATHVFSGFTRNRGLQPISYQDAYFVGEIKNACLIEAGDRIPGLTTTEEVQYDVELIGNYLLMLLRYFSKYEG